MILVNTIFQIPNKVHCIAYIYIYINVCVGLMLYVRWFQMWTKDSIGQQQPVFVISLGSFGTHWQWSYEIQLPNRTAFVLPIDSAIWKNKYPTQAIHKMCGQDWKSIYSVNCSIMNSILIKNYTHTPTPNTVNLWSTTV